MLTSVLTIAELRDSNANSRSPFSPQMGASLPGKVLESSGNQTSIQGPGVDSRAHVFNLRVEFPTPSVPENFVELFMTPKTDISSFVRN